VTSVLFISIGFIHSAAIMKNDIDNIIVLAASKAALEYDAYFTTIEDSVNAIHDHALQTIESDNEILTSKEKHEFYTNDISNLSLSMIENIKGASSVYYEYNPEIFGPKSGFWITFDEDNAVFAPKELYDLTAFKEGDERYAEWFYKPMQTKEAMWIGPYYDYDVNQNMYTYVSPVIYNDEFIGVIGMDINTDVLQEIAGSIEVYMDGNAFITDKNKNMLYSHYYPDGCAYEDLDESVKYKLDNIELNQIEEYTIFNNTCIAYMLELKPGMLIGINIPKSSFYKMQSHLFISCIIVTAICAVLALLLAVYLIKNTVKPLSNLTKAAEEIANGDYNKRLSVSGNDEVSVLATSLNNTLDTLNAYIKTLDEEAKLDFLTGLSNKNAFEKAEEALNEAISNGTDIFTVTVFDINNLKHVNDTYGHDAGDKLIVAVSTLIKKVYSDRLCFRMGGDEFVTIARNSNLLEAGKHIEKMQSLIDDYNKNGTNKNAFSHISVAIGAAEYIPDEDKTFIDVFNRADKQMYENKKNCKSRKY